MSPSISPSEPRISETLPSEVTPAATSFEIRPSALAAAAFLLSGLAITAYWLHGQGHVAHALSVLLGASFGLVLQRSRFCFFCMFRDWYEHRDASGLFGLLVALATGTIGYSFVFGAWLPDATTGRLPPDAFIGPVSLALVIAGVVFGIGMAISRSCVSAHLYRLGEGSPTSPFALIGTIAGFGLGFLTWNQFYLWTISGAQVIWLPGYFGYAGALIVAIGLLTLLAFALARTSDTPLTGAPDHGTTFQKIVVDRWPAWIGGAIVGVLGTVAYFRVAPLGVTAELSGRSRHITDALGLMPLRLEGLDTFRGCVTIMRDALLTPNGSFVCAMIVAAFAAALPAGQFRPAIPTMSQAVRGLTGGVLLGWGAMIGLGCTVGTLLSGIMAGALSGWVFAAAVFAGTTAVLWLETLILKRVSFAARQSVASDGIKAGS